jgi:hypothetical protein
VASVVATLALAGCGGASDDDPRRFEGDATVDDIARGGIASGQEVRISGLGYRLRGEGLVLVQSGFALLVRMGDDDARGATDGARVIVEGTTAEQDPALVRRLDRRRAAIARAAAPTRGEEALARAPIGPGSFFLRDASLAGD